MTTWTRGEAEQTRGCSPSRAEQGKQEPAGDQEDGDDGCLLPHPSVSARSQEGAVGHQPRVALLLVLLPAASAGQKAKQTLDQHSTHRAAS